jgi:hypothetical protein
MHEGYRNSISLRTEQTNEVCIQGSVISILHRGCEVGERIDTGSLFAPVKVMQSPARCIDEPVA